MCWALYLLGRVRHELPDEIAKKLIDTDDALAILTLYWASDAHKQMVVDYAMTMDQGDSHQLDRYWVLLYQLFFDGRIKNPYRTRSVLRYCETTRLVSCCPTMAFSPSPGTGCGILMAKTRGSGKQGTQYALFESAESMPVEQPARNSLLGDSATLWSMWTRVVTTLWQVLTPTTGLRAGVVRFPQAALR